MDVDGDSAFSTAHDFWGFQDAALGESPALMQPASPNLVVADTPGVVGLEIWCGTTPTPRGGTVIGSVSEYRHGVAAGTPYHVRLLAATTAAFDPQTTDPTTVAAAKTFDGTFVGTGGLVWTGNYSVSAVPAGQYYGFAWIDENNNTTFEAASDTWGFYQPYSNAPALSMPQVANITVTDAGFADIDLWCSAAWEEGGTIVGGVTLPYTNVHAGTPFHVLVLASDTPQVPMYDNMDASYVPDLGTPIQSADGAFVDQGDGVGWSIDYRLPSVPVGDFYLLVWVDVGGPTAQEPDGIFNPGYGDLWGFYDPTNLGSLQINWPSSANLTTTGGIFHADVWCDGVPVF